MVALRGENRNLELQGAENTSVGINKSNWKLKGKHLYANTPFTNRSLDSKTIFQGNFFVEIDKFIDFKLNIVDILKNDILDTGVSILDSQRVLLHSISFLVGFSFVLFTAGMIRYIKIMIKKYRNKNVKEDPLNWIDTTEISLAEWKGKQGTVVRIEDYEYTPKHESARDSESDGSTISDIESDSDEE